jgi:hypothetical protein
MATGTGPENALDHVVVVMFENRSFDNLLGRLYEPGEVASFEGVIGKELSNPIPDWAEGGAERGTVPYGVAENMNTPSPDPGEEVPHVNTQLFGTPLTRQTVAGSTPSPPTTSRVGAAQRRKEPSHGQYARKAATPRGMARCRSPASAEGTRLIDSPGRPARDPR